jgi:hypothetical protein
VLRGVNRYRGGGRTTCQQTGRLAASAADQQIVWLRLPREHERVRGDEASS